MYQPKDSKRTNVLAYHCKDKCTGNDKVADFNKLIQYQQLQLMQKLF